MSLPDVAASRLIVRSGCLEILSGGCVDKFIGCISVKEFGTSGYAVGLTFQRKFLSLTFQNFKLASQREPFPWVLRLSAWRERVEV
jgi:hypothetical protein